MSASVQIPPVSLAREPSFALGRLEVRPASREVVGPESRETLEPRVMQVLVALAKRRGEVVSRDGLALSCWEGRVVGEDAINRVLSRLRRLSERDGGRSFTLETITKVGYRLVEVAPAAEPAAVQSEPADAGASAAPAPPAAPARAIARRALWITAAATLAVAGLLAVLIMLLPAPQQRDAGRAHGPDRERYSDPARADFNAAKHGIDSDNAEEIARSLALLESVVQREPGWPEAWGCLAVAYLSSIPFTPPKGQEDMTKRARDAATRAVQLRPDQFQGNFVLAALTPYIGHWLEQRRTFKAMIDRSPGAKLYVSLLAMLAYSSGSVQEALDLWDRVGPQQENARTPGGHAALLAALGRVDEAARVLDDAARQWPRNISVFFSRFWFDLFNGRPEKALALIDDEAGRPTGIDPQDFELYRAAALAFITRKPEDIAKALEENIAAGARGRGYATNAMRMASALGDLDLAFQLADRVYFDRGEPLGALLFSGAQGQYATANFRPVLTLFDVSTAAMRHDLRIVAVFEELGLGDYWRKSGIWPDFCTGDPAAAQVCARLKVEP